ncbi:MAG: hypothetical protein CVU05_15540 [Bacteroidetes bacterium HGW-Bacteroidetes-21]|jgi:hypothetical protein|nr:MAG: hypothetical protein CVU05_15540 [Bacteroidetes bacterium HGW-Bacteroidetes-21]
MKILSILSMAVLLMSITSCSFEAKKDLTTGLEINATNLSVNETYLSVNGQKLPSSDVTLGSEVICYFDGVDGFVVKDNICMVGASMIVKDENGNEMLNEPDLFADYDEEGFSPEEVKVLTLSLSTGQPMEVGKSYTWDMKIWDKNGKGEIKANVKVNMK